MMGAMACGGSGDSPADTTATAVTAAMTATREAGCSPARPADAGDATRTITSGGVERRYIVHVAAGYDGTAPAPLMLEFHGLSMPAEMMAQYTGMPPRSDAGGYVVAAPYGLGDPARWNARLAAGAPDDVAFVRDLLAEVKTSLCIDSARVYAVGLSNGGGMAQRIACELPGVFAAVGVVAATYVACAPAVPVVAFHGNADPIVPYDGAEAPPNLGGGVFLPVRRALSEWAKALGCDGLPVISRPAQDAELSTFMRCRAGDGEALLYTLLGGGHTWPGSPIELSPAMVGVTSRSVDASAVILEFFAKHALPGRGG